MTSAPRTSTSVAVCADPEQPDTLARAEALAVRLGAPRCAPDSRAYAVLLCCTEDRLEARQTDSHAGPVYAEFEAGRFGYRRATGLRREAIVRAVRYRGEPLHVVDMTAGLGRDAMVLAGAGCRVTAVERVPAIFELLADGLQRARRDPDLRAIIEERLQLVPGDGVEVLASHGAPPPDAVYLDPMFPERTGSAVPAKELRLLARLAAPEDDARLLAAALASGCARVVVKRPRLAPPLTAPAAPPVTTRIEGRSSRFDVYVPPRLP
jgi:16S rRNA (guanine1516-N2)-methyltransferase